LGFGIWNLGFGIWDYELMIILYFGFINNSIYDSAERTEIPSFKKMESLSQSPIPIPFEKHKNVEIRHALSLRSQHNTIGSIKRTEILSFTEMESLSQRVVSFQAEKTFPI